MAKMAKGNLEEPVGDRKYVKAQSSVCRSALIFRSLYLLPKHHDKRITPAAGAVINQWMVPHLGAHKICASARAW